MAKQRTLVDCYTDEPAGLGVPPFLGTWARLAAGQARTLPAYLTIDDVRLASLSAPCPPHTLDPPTGRTKSSLLNTTRPYAEIRTILQQTDQFIIVAGIQTPGKYLRAVPGTLHEIGNLLKPYRGTKILTGPAAALGSQSFGGRYAEQAEAFFDEMRPITFTDYDEVQEWFLKGAAIASSYPGRCIVELETGRGCPRNPGCSFCTEPLKGSVLWRAPELVLEEAKQLRSLGVQAFRLGKQSCMFSYCNGAVSDLEQLLSGMAALNPTVLHIDNANPAMVTEERVKLFVRYLTPGSTAAMGAESFDPAVITANNLNTNFEQTLAAVEILNRLGGHRGENGMHALLPGINILLGLAGETRETLEKNFSGLKHILDAGLMIRRINIRQVAIFPGTKMAEVGMRYLRKNKRHYKSWMERVRREIDFPFLQRLFPKGTVLTNCASEVHEGNVTFLRQLGSYPIIVGVRERLPLDNEYRIRVVDHMLRSLVGEVEDC